MKLVAYYALHTFINQIRKLFRTWFLIYLVVCIAFGAFIGFGISVLQESGGNEARIEEGKTEYDDNAADTAEEAGSEAEAYSPLSMLKTYTGLEADQAVKLITALLILGIILYEIAGSRERGSVLFLPADVNILFSSPLCPQSVLLYRLSLTMGIYVFFVIYLSFTLRSWFSFMDLSWGRSVLLLTAIFAGIIYAKLLKTYAYLAASENPFIRKIIRYCIFAFIGLALVGVFLFKEMTNESPAAALYRLVESDSSSFIPVWGWLKAAIFSVTENKVEAAVLHYEIGRASCRERV